MTNELPGFLQQEDFTGAEPKLSFFSFQDQFGQGQNQRNYFRGQFQNFFNQFLGTLGQDLRQGQSPTRTFEDFLGGVDFNQQFASIAPSLRGANTARFAPPTSFLNF
jgi:hypothetical protein